MKTKLLASCDGTREAAEKMINKYFASSFWRIKDCGNEWNAFNIVKGRTLSDFSMGLELEKGRFRLVKYGDY